MTKIHVSRMWLWGLPAPVREVRGITTASASHCVLVSQELTISRPDFSFSLQRTKLRDLPVAVLAGKLHLF